MVLVIIVLVLGGVGWYLKGQVDDIVTDINDTLISDDQRDFLDDMSSESDCDQLRAWLVEAQSLLMSPDPLQMPFLERAADTAERQLDTLRCGG